jgi:RNA polymerase sigma factor (sigma-70 family)
VEKIDILRANRPVANQRVEIDDPSPKFSISFSDAEPFLMRSGGQEARHTLRDFNRALAQLPEQQRTVILLIGVEGMSYVRAAEAMNCAVGTVRSRLFRGREALHHLMGVQ